MPTYREIADSLAVRIAAGEWKPGERIPTTNDVAREYRSSEATAYRALVLLIDRGVVEGRRGSGRFVPDK